MRYIQKLVLKLDKALSNTIDIIISQMKQRKELILQFSEPIRSTQNIATIHDKVYNESGKIAELLKDDNKSLDGLDLSEESLHTVKMGRNAGAIRLSILSAVDQAMGIKVMLIE